MWILDQLVAVCVSLSLGCSEELPKPVPLPKDDRRAWDYTPPTKPTPTPAITVAPQVPAPEPSVTVINVQPPAPTPAPKPKPAPAPPKVDPALEASKKLLMKRRLDALDGTLPTLNAQGTSSDIQIPDTKAKPSATPLGVNSPQTQERYEASSLDSGLPVDNTRIITETEPIPVILREAINSQICLLYTSPSPRD